MKKEIICVLVFMLMIITVLPVSATLPQKSNLLIDRGIGEKWSFKSLSEIPSPDGNSYRCIMFCENHEQTLQWISLINESGFEKAWQKKFLELTIFFILPGTISLFGLGGFRNWYAELVVQLQHKNEFLNFLNTYEAENGSGMIIYLWLSGITNRPVDFRAQPDNSWVENSWILEPSGVYMPNPDIWDKFFAWYFDFPWD